MRKLVSSLHGLTKRYYLCAHRIPFSPLPPRHWFSSSCARSFPAEDHTNTQASSTSITGQDDSHSTTSITEDDSHSTTTGQDDSHASTTGQDDSHSSSTTTITRDDSHASSTSITTGQDDTRTSAVHDPIDKILQELESKRREADVNGRKVEMAASDDTTSSSRAPPSRIFSTPEHCAVETREQLAQRPVEANFELLDPHVKPSNPRALLIDGTPLVVRAYHGTPPMNTPDGTPIHAVVTYIKSILNLLVEQPHQLVGVFFDSGKATVRTAIDSDYKAHRKPIDNDLKVQLPIAFEATKSLGLQAIKQSGYEADDLIATFTRMAVSQGYQVTIVSSDKDLMQLVQDDQVCVYDPYKKLVSTAKDVKEKFGVEPGQVAHLLALTGDVADNISGVSGIGKKRAIKLITDFGNIHDLIDNVDKVGDGKKLRETIMAEKDKLLNSYALVCLHDNLETGIPLEELKPKGFNFETLTEFLNTYNLQSIVRLLQAKRKTYTYLANGQNVPASLIISKKQKSTTEQEEGTKLKPGMEMVNIATADGKLEEKQPKSRLLKIEAENLGNHFKTEYHIADTAEKLQLFIDAATKKGTVSFSTKLSMQDSYNHELVGISLSIEAHKGCYVPLLHISPNEAEPDFLYSKIILREHPLLSMLKTQIFENREITKVGHNVKEHIKNLIPYGVSVDNFDDVMVMSYVLNCGKHEQDIESLIQALCNEDPATSLLQERDVLGLGKKKLTFAKANLHAAAHYVCQFADFAQRIYEVLKPQLDKSARLTKMYNTLELPLVTTLAAVEMTGVKVDREGLHQLQAEYEQRIRKTSEDIIKEAGNDLDGVFDEDEQEHILNVNSNRQLGRVIFNILLPNSPYAKKSKTGDYVLDSDTLEQLKHEGLQIAKLILEYRVLSKLYSTYILGLQQHINPYTHRVHTTFQNALTVTGRLSSVSPNIQNIPIRTTEGKQIRKFFVASEGHVLLKADYSQVELRILAHIANIESMKNAFKEGKDVHSITASQVFGVPVAKVDKELRRKAKAINFGIIYGMSEYGLARQINVSVDDAAKYITSYFKQYPGIKQYMDSTKKFCAQNGYVNTLFGRKCWVLDINSKNKTKRGFAERTCINTPIQGTSADITKIAMIRLFEEFTRRKLKTKMIIQVHDEIVFEVPVEEKEIVKVLIKEIMESPGLDANFSVPLTVDVDETQRWLVSEL